MSPLTGEARRQYMAAYRAGPEGETERAARRDPETKARYNEGRRKWREATGAGSAARRFVGIDGEGGNVGTRHEYLLLRAGNHTLNTGRPLKPSECLGFIADLPLGVTYVGYFFDYDVTMICRDLPPGKVHRLVTRSIRTRDSRNGGQVTFPVDVDLGEGGAFQIDYLPRKEFRVRRCLGIEGDKRVYAPWRVVSDVGAFFQCSFMKALTEWDIGTPEQREAIAAGKDARADFGQLSAETDAYNVLEIDLTEQLMTRFRDMCRETTYVPGRWQGPGNIAVAMLRRHGTVKARELDSMPEGMVTFAGNAYYGGRFETTRAGQIAKGAYQYDINSAYPDAMQHLPCLRHASYQHNKVAGRTVYYGHFESVHDALLYSFPIRRDQGSIYYPAEGNGWYWDVEIAAAVHQTFTPVESWSVVTDCDCQPFEWVDPIYQQRLALGKAVRGRPLKLGLNSLYGKCCQSIGQAPYANPIYASLITAETRAVLNGAAHGGPGCCADCYMLATDAVFTGQPRSLPLGRELGQWEETRYDELFIIQPGLYFTDSNVPPKTRGVPQAAVVKQRADFIAAYNMLIVGGFMDSPLAKVDVKLRQFTGLRLADARGKPETAGLWSEVTKSVGFDWATKRVPGVVQYDTSTNAVITYPYAGSPEVVTTPYSKDIGRMLTLRRLLTGVDGTDQPDWSDYVGEGGEQ